MIISGSDLEIYWLPSISPPSYFAHHNNKICCLHQRELDICFPCSKFAPHNTFCWLQIFDLGPSFQQKIISTASAKSKKKKKYVGPRHCMLLKCSQVPQPTCSWKWHPDTCQLGNPTNYHLFICKCKKWKVALVKLDPWCELIWRHGSTDWYLIVLGW